MKIVLYGASGMIGSRILNELVSRGHHVTAVVRDASKIAANPLVTAKAGDVLSPASIAETAAGADAVISAFAPPFTAVGQLVEATKALIAGVAQTGVKRLLVVGGAGSLQVAPGLQLIDAPGFPPDWKAIAQAHSDALAVIKTADLDWTSFSPAAMIEPGVRTGVFRLGLEELISDTSGQSRISAEDYAIAMVDELEQSQHVRQRFTAGY